LLYILVPLYVSILYIYKKKILVNQSTKITLVLVCLQASKKVLKSLLIIEKTKQIEASSHDGQYYHLSVPKSLVKLYNLPNQFISTPDPLHRAGTVDVHIRKDETFDWMNKVFGICKELYNKFNWGKNYELMVDSCDEIKKNMAQLANFQTTSFANSVRFVVINLRTDYEILLRCLVKIQDNLRDSGDNKDQEKFNDVKRLHDMIKNKRFCMNLSGLTDVYGEFGSFVNIIQKVDILPHERYDSAIKILDKMVKMKNQLSCHEKCMENKSCLWPNYHEDQKKLNCNETYQNVRIDRDKDSRPYRTRLAMLTEKLEKLGNPMNQAEANIGILINRLEEDVRQKVFFSRND